MEILPFNPRGRNPIWRDGTCNWEATLEGQLFIKERDLNDRATFQIRIFFRGTDPPFGNFSVPSTSSQVLRP